MYRQVVLYACMDGWMDGCMDIYICMHACMYVCIYVCLYGRSAGTLIFSTSGARHGRDEDGKVPGYRKMRPLLPNMMLRNSSN